MTQPFHSALLLLLQEVAPAASPVVTPSPTPVSVHSLTDVFTKLYDGFYAALPGIITGIAVFAVFFFVAAIGKRIIALTAPRVRADTGAVLLLARVYYYGVLTFGVLTALPFFGLNVSALVAGLGLTGFALGFALKDVLSNLLSGIMLLIYRPFQIGDHIKMGEFEGAITTIRMRDTVLRAPDGRTIIIPNTKLITEVVVNNSTAQLAREGVQVSVPADADLNRARSTLVKALEDYPAADGYRAEPQVTLGKSADGSTIIEGFYLFDPRRLVRAGVREGVARRIKTAFDEMGVRVGFPSKPVETKAVSGAPTTDAEEPSAPGTL